MIVILSPYGRTCNRLFQYSHYLAFGKSNNIRVFNPTFFDISHYFNSKRRCLLVGILNKMVIFLIKVIIKVGFIKCINFEEEVDNNPYNKEELRCKKIVAVKGWFSRDDISFLENSDYLRGKFTPNTLYLMEIENLIRFLKNNYERVFGIHIRRGDYKLWNQGKYYFTDSVYLEYINKLKTIFNMKSCFIIVSDELISTDYFRDDCFIYSGGIIKDLYLLSMCDYILGPPSTFSAWASFYGYVPLCYIYEEDQTLSLDDFTFPFQ